MSLLAQIRGGLANAQHEVSKHVNAANIHRAIENVQNSIHVGSTASKLDYLRSIATGIGNQAPLEKQTNQDNPTPSPAEAAQDSCPYIEVKMTRAEDASMTATSNLKAGSSIADTEIVGECSSINTQSERATCACKCDEENSPQSTKNFVGDAQAMARRLGQTAWENPLLAAATVATGTGLLVVAAPAIVTAPMMGLAGAAGFTPAGIAASSVASALQASVGNVAVGSIFATLQSAATGGYGVAVLAGAAQTAGGAVAGASGLGGIVTYLKGKDKPQPEPTEEENNEKMKK